MKKISFVAGILFLAVVFIAPVSASAETNAGIGPSSFFYVFDTAFEKINLFFTFDAEKKARKALEHAEERLAEAEESANENDLKSVEKAMENYEDKIMLATEKSKELKDEKKEEALLNTISENTARHQKVLAGVLEKVPEEAKGAIRKAIEMSKKGQEVAMKQIKELKKENKELRKEIQELKEELEEKEALRKADDEITEEQSQPKQTSFSLDEIREMEKLRTEEERKATEKQLAEQKIEEQERIEREKRVAEEQDNINALKKITTVLKKSKGNLEELYSAAETNKRNLAETKLRFLDSRIKDLNQSISSIEDCSVSRASDIARVNATYDDRVAEIKRIYQKNIDSRRAYGDETSAVLQEQELADKIRQIERERNIETEKIKVACESGLGLLKKSLQIVVDSVKRGRDELSEYTNSYSELQQEITKKITSIELRLKKTKNGQRKETITARDNYFLKIIVSRLNSISSNVERKFNSIDSNYRSLLDSAFRNMSIVQGVNSELNSISDRARLNTEIKNIPTQCWSTTQYSGGINGKAETSIRCENGNNNPVRCWSTTQYSGGINGTSKTSMRCE